MERTQYNGKNSECERRESVDSCDFDVDRAFSVQHRLRISALCTYF